MIDFACTSCGQVFRVNDDWAGKRARCKKCGSSVEVPGGAELLLDEDVPPSVGPSFLQRAWKRTATFAKWSVKQGYLWYALPLISVTSMLIGLVMTALCNDRDGLGKGMGQVMFWGSIVVGLKLLRIAQQHQFRCPSCSERIQASARVCRHCGNSVVTYEAAPAVQRRRFVTESEPAADSGGVGSLALTLGVLLLLGGLAVATYFFAAFDVSVATESGDRVVNMQKMSDRQSGLIFGIALAVVGGVVAALGNRRGTGSSSAGGSTAATKAIVLFILGLALWLAGHFLKSLGQR